MKNMGLEAVCAALILGGLSSAAAAAWSPCSVWVLGISPDFRVLVSRVSHVQGIRPWVEGDAVD